MSVPKMSKTKEMWRDHNVEHCEFIPLEDRQEFRGGRKVVMLYHTSRPAKGGYVDAMWIERIEIHHNVDGKCKTYYDDRWHDSLRMEDAFIDGRFIRGSRPIIRDVRIQRDGATLMVVDGDFRYSNFQAAELIAVV